VSNTVFFFSEKWKFENVTGMKSGFSFSAKFCWNFQNFAFFAKVQKKIYWLNFSVKFIFRFKITSNHTKMTHHISYSYQSPKFL